MLNPLSRLIREPVTKLPTSVNPPPKKPQNAPFSHSGCLREDGSGVEALAAREGAGRPAAIYGRCQHPLTALAARCCTHGRERP